MSYSLFEVFGIELEYMIVDQETLAIRPLAEVLFDSSNGEVESDKVVGPVTWSNELAAHVVELKTSEPTRDIETYESHFLSNIAEINTKLGEYGAMLLPSAQHPFMNPKLEGELWKHSGAEIYRCYETLFDIHSHGWLNLQSVHLNLPFNGDEEFARLHAAIRVLLPILPALAASSPILEGKLTGVKDSRLQQYLLHQVKLKSSMGLIIPEACRSEEEYRQTVLLPIGEELLTVDSSGILKPKFLNARGAIARFERGSIEIRLLDIGESPKVDIAICAFIVALLRSLVDGKLLSHDLQERASTVELRSQLDEVISFGSEARLVPQFIFTKDERYSSLGNVKELLTYLFEEVAGTFSSSPKETIRFLLEKGNLSKRILARSGETPSEQTISQIYRELSKCLQNNTLFE